MTLDEFEPLVQRSFEVDCEPNSISLTLVEATPIRPSGQDERPPFSLIFHSGVEILLVAGTYRMRCGNFGPDLIDIAPVMPTRRAAPGHYYQAVFN